VRSRGVSVFALRSWTPQPSPGRARPGSTGSGPPHGWTPARRTGGTGCGRRRWAVPRPSRATPRAWPGPAPNWPGRRTPSWRPTRSHPARADPASGPRSRPASPTASPRSTVSCWRWATERDARERCGAGARPRAVPGRGRAGRSRAPGRLPLLGAVPAGHGW